MSKGKTILVQLGVGTVAVAAVTVAYHTVLVALLADKRISEQRPLAEPHEIGALAEPLKPRWASVEAVATVTRTNTHADVQVRGVGEQCQQGFPLIADAGRGAYVLHPPSAGELTLVERACLAVATTVSGSPLAAPGGRALGIDGHSIDVSDIATFGTALPALGGPWYATAVAARVEGSYSVAINFSRSPGTWTLRVPGHGDAPSVAALLHPDEVALWRATFTMEEGPIEVEDGTAAVTSPGTTNEAPGPLSEDYTPLE